MGCLKKVNLGFLFNLSLVLSVPFLVDFYILGGRFLGHNFPLFQIFFFAFFSCIVISRASDSFESGADYLAEKMKLGAGIKGATIDAVAGSFPEMISTMIFLLLMKDASGFAGGIATTAGSGIFNIIVIPFFIILFVKFIFGHKGEITINKKIVLRDGLSLIVSTFIFIKIANSDVLNCWHGLAMVMIYVCYLILLKFWEVEGNTDNDELFESHKENLENISADKNVLCKKGRAKKFLMLNFEEAISANKDLHIKRSLKLVLISMMLMGVACHILVEACNILGEYLGVASYIIAIIFVAGATSIPDTILSIKSAKKGKYEDALTNALGSNIFDISFAIGLPLFLFSAFYGGINMVGTASSSFIAEFQIILLLLTISLVVMFLISKVMGRIQMIILGMIYALFLFYVYCFAYGCDCALFSWLQNGILFIRDLIL